MILSVIGLSSLAKDSSGLSSFSFVSVLGGYEGSPSRRASMLIGFSSARAVEGLFKIPGTEFSIMRGFLEKSTGSMLDLMIG